MSNYRIQIIDVRDGEVVRWRAGMPIESDILQELCDRLQKKGVGWFRSEAKVLEAVKTEFAGVIWDLKSKTVYNPDSR